MVAQENFPKTVNGDNVVRFTSSKLLTRKGHTDLAALEDWYKEDPASNYLGIVEPIARREQIATPLLNSVLREGGKILVNGYDGKFHYDLPVTKTTGTYTLYDTSGENIKPGIDQGLFRIGLDSEFAPGDVITYDAYRGAQAVVSGELVPRREGDVYFHYCRVNSTDKRTWFPAEFLRPGIQYFKIGHVAGEFSTQLSNINFGAETALIGCEFTLGNLRGVEHTTTMHAGNKLLQGAALQTREFLQKVESRANSMSTGSDLIDSVIIGRTGPNGNLIKDSAKVMSIMEYMAFAELIKLENWQLMFQRGGLIPDNNSVIRLNEGYYHQLRRGFRLEYPRPGHIPIDVLRQASEYIYQGRRDIRVEDRFITFKAGMKAYENVISLLTKEFNIQIQFLMPLLGGDRLINNPVSGPNDALKLGVVRVAQCFVPGVGNVRIEHEPSLDWQPLADRTQQGFYDSYPRSSYSLLISDITSSSASNAFDGVPNRSNNDIRNPNANVFYITPKQGSLSWGFQNGRFDYRSNANIFATNPKFAQNFFCYSSSALWIKDLSRHVLIELGDTFNYI